MSKLFWALGAALAALVLARVALQWRAADRSPLHRLAREYLREQLTALGIADQIPARRIADIAERYACAADLRPLGRIAAASQLMKRLDLAIAAIAEWVRSGRELPRNLAEMPLPGLGPDALQELDVPGFED